MNYFNFKGYTKNNHNYKVLLNIKNGEIVNE